MKIKKKHKKRKVFHKYSLGKEVNVFIENLSMLVNAGMDPATSVNAIRLETRSKPMKEFLGLIYQELENGSTLSKALNMHKIFTPNIISLISIGEESGNLAKNLAIVAAQEEKSRDFRSKIRSAMMYPTLVLFLTLVIGLGVAWFILPRLSIVFSQLKIELPLLTRILLKVGSFIGEYGYIAIPGLITFLIISFIFLFVAKSTKHIGQSIMLSLPVIKKLIIEIELSRFGYLMGTLLESGIPIKQAFKSIIYSTEFRQFKRFYTNLGYQVHEGQSFQTSFKKLKQTNKYIPISIQQMISAAQNSGNLAPTLIHIGKIYEAKTENTTKNLTVILEPILLVIIWLGVIGVALAIISPIYSITSGIN